MLLTTHNCKAKRTGDESAYSTQGLVPRTYLKNELTKKQKMTVSIQRASLIVENL